MRDVVEWVVWVVCAIRMTMWGRVGPCLHIESS
jgi:hypothetical protein